MRKFFIEGESVNLNIRTNQGTVILCVNRKEYDFIVDSVNAYIEQDPIFNAMRDDLNGEEINNTEASGD